MDVKPENRKKSGDADAAGMLVLQYFVNDTKFFFLNLKKKKLKKLKILLKMNQMIILMKSMNFL